METRANYTAVGGFVLVIITGLVLFLLWMSKVNFGDASHYYDIYFDGAVTGLRENEDVRYHGIAIGAVEEITIDPDRMDRARVRISVDEPELIREGVYASIEARGLTGFAYIQLNGGSKNKPSLQAKKGEPYPVIPSRSSGLQRVVAEAPMILERLYEVLGHIDEMLDEPTREHVRKTLAHVATISGKLAEGEGSLDATMISLRRTLDKISSLTGSAEGAVQGMGESATQLGHFLRDSQDLWQANLRQLSATLYEMGQAANAILHLVNELEHSPGQFLGKSTDKGVDVQ